MDQKCWTCIVLQLISSPRNHCFGNTYFVCFKENVTLTLTSRLKAPSDVRGGRGFIHQWWLASRPSALYTSTDWSWLDQLLLHTGGPQRCWGSAVSTDPRKGELTHRLDIQTCVKSFTNEGYALVIVKWLWDTFKMDRQLYVTKTYR